MSRVLRWTIGLLILAAVGGGVAWMLIDAYGAQEEAGGGEAAPPPVGSATRAAGTVEVVLTPEAVAAAGIKTAPLAATTLDPEVVAYGRLEEDPSGSFTLRAPLPGVLRTAPEVPWPAVGATLSDGATLGWIEPRFAPAERVDLAARRVAAASARDAAAAELSAARAALDRMRTLHAQDHNVSDRALQEAQVAVDTARARLREAADTVQILEAALAAGSADAGTTPVYPVGVERGGEVVETPAQPGETVDSGEALLRVVRFDRLLARIDLPAGETIAEPPAMARLVAFGAEDRPLPAAWLGPAPEADPQTPGRALRFVVDARGTELRPGAAVTAHLRAVGASLPGVLVPGAAVVRTGGRAWAWVTQGGDRFQRREVPLDRPAADGWFAREGWTAGEQVVVVGAQILLSEEMQSAGAGGGGGE